MSSSSVESITGALYAAAGRDATERHPDSRAIAATRGA
jgi:hypothetical protein